MARPLPLRLVTGQVRVLAESFCWKRREWTILDPDWEPHLKALAAVADGELFLKTAKTSLEDQPLVA